MHTGMAIFHSLVALHAPAMYPMQKQTRPARKKKQAATARDPFDAGDGFRRSILKFLVVRRSATHEETEKPSPGTGN